MTATNTTISVDYLDLDRMQSYDNPKARDLVVVEVESLCHIQGSLDQMLAFVDWMHAQVHDIQATRQAATVELEASNIPVVDR